MATTAAHRWRQESEECSREFSLALTQNLLTHIHDTHVMMKICAHIAAQGHTHTWLQTDLLSLSKLGQFFYVINLTPWWQKRETTYNLPMWFIFVMFYCWCLLLVWGFLCCVFDTVGWIDGKGKIKYLSVGLVLIFFSVGLFLWKSVYV